MISYFDMQFLLNVCHNLGKPNKISINDAGKLGFGVGVAPQAALASIGNLTPMEGYDDPSSDNYGNYQGDDGSVMCFIPAFCYRSGYDTAPTKERDGLNALEITYDTSMEGQDGWILHRAFWNGGQRISGFFIDKYMACNNSDYTGCVSQHHGEALTLSSSSEYNPTSQIPDCKGVLYDAVTLGRKRGSRYCCASLFAYSAIAMLSLAHSQACGDSNTEYCAWNDDNPWCKGNNNDHSDYYDTTIIFVVAATKPYDKCTAGSAFPEFAKTTHNGQNCGIADINGSLQEVALGVTQPRSSSDSRYGKLLILKTSADICTINQYGIGIDDSASLYDEVDYTRNAQYDSRYAWSNKTAQFSQDTSGADWALTGCYPRRNGEVTSSQIADLIKGCYAINGACTKYECYCPLVGGLYNDNREAGLFSREYSGWNSGVNIYGFRCMAVPTA